jgi:hypothetical protein
MWSSRRPTRANAKHESWSSKSNEEPMPTARFISQLHFPPWVRERRVQLATGSPGFDLGRGQGIAKTAQIGQVLCIPIGIVAELNETFALVLTGGKALLLREIVTGKGWRDFELLQNDAFRQWFANRFASGSGANAKPIPLAHYWLTHPQRREYGLRFAPQNDAGRAYNLLARGLPLRRSQAIARCFSTIFAITYAKVMKRCSIGSLAGSPTSYSILPPNAAQRWCYAARWVPAKRLSEKSSGRCSAGVTR